MNATELAKVYIMNEAEMYQDCKRIARAASNKNEAADLIIDYITEVIDEYRPTKGRGWELVCDALELFTHSLDFSDLATFAEQLKKDEL